MASESKSSILTLDGEEEETELDAGKDEVAGMKKMRVASMKSENPRSHGTVVPRFRLHNMELMERFLPVRELVYQQRPISKVKVHGPKNIKDLVGLSRIFLGVTLKEIANKKWLEKEIMEMAVALVKRIQQVSPVSFLLKHAPVHCLEHACQPDAQQSDGPSNFTSDLRSGEFPTFSSKSPFSINTAKEEHANQIQAFKNYLQNNSTETVSLERIATPVSEVFNFVRAYCVVVIDKKVLGSNYNRTVLEKYLGCYLRLGLNDQLPISEMRLADIPWLKRVVPANYELFASDFLLWLFRCVINVVINRMFYVTDTLFLKSQILFFRREIWYLMGKSAIQEYIKLKLWHPMSPDVVELFMEFRKHQSVAYRARLMPRKHGLRPIMVRQPMNLHQVTKWDIKNRLKQIRLVLSYLVDLYKIRGIGKASLEEIQSSWIKFRRNHYESGSRELYFVTCDVKQAYDQVDCDKLCSILEQLRLKALRNELQFFYIYDKTKAQPDKQTPGPRFKVISKANFKAGFISEGMGQPDCVDIEFVFEELLRMARPAVFQTSDKKWYGFSRGIPQGSPLSGLFLNLYFGQLETELQCQILPEEYLTRWIDDLVFITPSTSRTQQFLKGVNQGFPGLSLYAGQAKTHTNYPYSDPSLPQCSHKSVKMLHWYGWHINLDDLSITADLSRFTVFNLRYGATVNYYDGEVLTRSLVATLTGKYAPVLFNTQALPRSAVFQNICELFLLFACSLRRYWLCSSKLQRCTSEVMNLICLILDKLVMKVMWMLKIGDISDISHCMVKFLAWKALSFVLAGKGTQTAFASPFQKDTKGCIRNRKKAAWKSCLYELNNEVRARELESFSEKFIDDCPQEIRIL